MTVSRETRSPDACGRADQGADRRSFPSSGSSPDRGASARAATHHGSSMFALLFVARVGAEV